MPLSPERIQGLRRVAGEAQVRTAPEDCWAYGYDNSRLHALPDAVVFATDHEQIRRVVRWCYENRVPITARGRGTGTTCAVVPAQGGIVLSLERMDRIVEFRPEDRFIRVEPGITNQALQDAVGARGFFWPPDPTSAAFCTVGGNLAYNSAGPRAVKYGTPRENTLGLTAVTGTGETIRTGVRTTKGVVGLDLTRLLIGSEGTLAIITEATLKLTPLPEAVRTLRGWYRDVAAAAKAVSSVMAQPAIPRALEFMDDTALGLIRGTGREGIPEAAGALLMIEVDGPRSCIEFEVEAVMRAARVEGCLRIDASRSAEEAAALWAARKALSPALRLAAPDKINEDVVVPVSRIPELIDGLRHLSREHGLQIVNFGHAGNGNIHVNLLYDAAEPHAAERARACLDEVFRLVLELEGSISGEHGVGLVKRDFVAREIEAETLRLMERLKAVFDPRGLLNPGKAVAAPTG
jgi:D-lactate dehydrogenase